MGREVVEEHRAASRRSCCGRGSRRRLRALHRVWSEGSGGTRRREEAAMTAINGEHVESAVIAARRRDNIMVDGEIVRHRAATRWIHWGVALTFFLGLITGMPIWTPIFRWMA